jgi:hypothetical protein
MRKHKEPESTEIVSLNEEIFSLEAGNLTVEELERRLELAIATVKTFTCGTFDCGSFSCADFKVVKAPAQLAPGDLAA